MASVIIGNRYVVSAGREISGRLRGLTSGIVPEIGVRFRSARQGRSRRAVAAAEAIHVRMRSRYFRLQDGDAAAYRITVVGVRHRIVISSSRQAAKIGSGAGNVE